MNDLQIIQNEKENEELDQLYQELQQGTRKDSYCLACNTSKYILHTVVGYDFCTKCQDDKDIITGVDIINCNHTHTSDCRRNGCPCFDDHYCNN